jgi:TatD DNase family protein
VSEEEIARQTTENFFRLFKKVPRSLHVNKTDAGVA